MNKLPVLVLIFFTVVLSCKFTESEPAAVDIVCRDTVDLNPNGSSELSLLMRKMEAHAAAAQKDVAAKKLPGVFPQEFVTIYTAKPTDSTTKTSGFDSYADAYIHAVNIFHSSAEDNLLENYNNIVNACLACHSQHCPGPVSRIKKLLIQESSK